MLLAAAADGTFLGGDDLPVYLLVAAHDFSAGRWDGRWAGLGGPIALSAASELAAALAHDSQGLFVFIVLAASAAGRALREREQLAALWDKETRFWLAAWGGGCSVAPTPRD